MEKSKKLHYGIYNDFYSGMLTNRQSEVIRMYYDEDLSLNEIAERLSISPQGVMDALKHGEKSLDSFEEKLGLVKKSNLCIELLEELKAVVDKVDSKYVEKINSVISVLEN